MTPVSVWVGSGTDETAFQRLLEYTIGEQGLGEFEASPFCRAYGVMHYDPGHFEGKYFERPLAPRLLFLGLPFREEASRACGESARFNAYVLLIELQYDGQIADIEIGGFRFHFLGTYVTE